MIKISVVFISGEEIILAEISIVGAVNYIIIKIEVNSKMLKINYSQV